MLTMFHPALTMKCFGAGTTHRFVHLEHAIEDDPGEPAGRARPIARKRLPPDARYITLAAGGIGNEAFITSVAPCTGLDCRCPTGFRRLRTAYYYNPTHTLPGRKDWSRQMWPADHRPPVVGAFMPNSIPRPVRQMAPDSAIHDKNVTICAAYTTVLEYHDLFG